MVKESIVMTVSNREPLILGNTLRFLAMSDMSESELVIVDDASDPPLDWLEPDKMGVACQVVRLDPYECYKTAGNYNNPAKAFNAGLQAALGERVLLLSSDVLVPPHVLAAARKTYDGSFIYCPQAIDLATTIEYCGPHRFFPMPWFLYAPREACIGCGGWDENYLLGLCFEDNDFVGRLALRLKKLVCDWTSIVWHQSHYQPAYVDDHWVQAANKRNEAYTKDKWVGSIPFGPPDLLAFAYKRTRNESNGHLMFEFEDIKNIYDSVRAKTRSPFDGRKGGVLF